MIPSRATVFPDSADSLAFFCLLIPDKPNGFAFCLPTAAPFSPKKNSDETLIYSANLL